MQIRIRTEGSECVMTESEMDSEFMDSLKTRWVAMLVDNMRSLRRMDDWQSEVVAECKRLGVSIIVDARGQVDWRSTEICCLYGALAHPADAAYKRIHEAAGGLALAVPHGAGIAVDGGVRELTRIEREVAALWAEASLARWRETAPKGGDA